MRESEECEWLLLYPDFDPVLNVPGTEKPFSVMDYKDSIGRPFARVNLYLCRMSEYEGERKKSKHVLNDFFFLSKISCI